MKIGAQLYSVRNQAKTPAEIRAAFQAFHEMGYQAVHLSGIDEIDPYELRDLSQEFLLPVTVSHVPIARLRENLDEVIREHGIFSCPVIGLGIMPKELRDGTFASFRRFYDEMMEISRRIEAAGLKFAYHNHAFEFVKLDNGISIYDFLLEENENWDLIADICWIEYGGAPLIETLRRARGRIRNAHLKDIRDFAGKEFCPLGEGCVSVAAALPVLDECGCEFAHVEQDNATQLADPFGEMRRSAEYLKKNNYLK